MHDRFLAPWIAATVVGFAAGGATWALLTILTGYLQTDIPFFDWSVPLTSTAVAGVATGVSQGRVMERLTYRVEGRAWAVTTTLGTLSAFIAIGLLGREFALSFGVSGAYISLPLYPSVTTGGLDTSTLIHTLALSVTFLYYGCVLASVVAAGGGVLVGFLQWMVLRKQFRDAFLFIPASVLAWALSGVASVIVSWVGGSLLGGATVVQSNASVAALVGLATWCSVGLTIGAVMAPVVSWLQQQPLEEGTLF